MAAFLLVVLVAFVPVAAQEVSTKTIANVKRAILPVTCGALDDKNQFRVVQIVASGFLINERGDFLTAAHVADDLAKFASQNHCFGAIYLTVEAPVSEALVQTRWYRIRTCRTNPQLDVAVCFLTEKRHCETRDVLSSRLEGLVSLAVLEWASDS